MILPLRCRASEWVNTVFSLQLPGGAVANLRSYHCCCRLTEWRCWYLEDHLWQINHACCHHFHFSVTFSFPFQWKNKHRLTGNGQAWRKKLRSKLSYRYSQILILCTCTRSLRHCVIIAIVGQTGGRYAIAVFLDREDVAPTARFLTLGKIKN